MYVQLLSRPLKGLCPAATQKLFPVSTGCCDATYYKTQLEQELLTIPEHPRSYTVFSGVRVTRSLVLCVCFVDCCLSFCTFCSSSIYGFWVPLWCLQTLLKTKFHFTGKLHLVSLCICAILQFCILRNSKFDYEIYLKFNMHVLLRLFFILKLFMLSNAWMYLFINTQGAVVAVIIW